MGTSKINTLNWKKYIIGDLFEASNTGNILAREVVDGSGSTPFVTASGANNGVAAYVDASNFDIIKGNCILIGGKTFTLTYQNADFISNDSHNIVIRFKNKKLSRFHYMYVLSVIRASLTTKYMWSDAVTKAKLLVEEIPLPINPNGEINYNYMETYMKEIEDKSKKRIQKIIQLYSSTSQKIDVTTWKEFRLDSLFEIIKGSRLRMQDMKEGNYNYIGASSFNNGITNRIGNDAKIHPASTITVSYNGSVGQAFYQSSSY